MKNPHPVPSRAARVALPALAGAMTLLAFFQIWQLIALDRGERTLCGTGEIINCEQVWRSPFASTVQSVTGMPIAVLGAVWGLTALFLSLWLSRPLWRRIPAETAAGAVHLTAAAGVTACAVFATASVAARALCVTCLGTYLLVLAFAVVAFRSLGSPARSPSSWIGGAGMALGIAAAFYAIFLPAGLAARHGLAQGFPRVSQVPAPPELIREYMAGLADGERLAVSNSLAFHRQAPPPPLESYPVRRRLGPADAPTQLVEFTDLLCSHCKRLQDELHAVRAALPEDAVSIQARQYPLDSECNPDMQRTDGTGIRCTGAKALICLERAPDYWTLREWLFNEQRTLTKERVLQIASGGSVPREELEACIASADTQRKLEDDLRYANAYGIRGTPLVLINGREGTAVGSFLWALIAAGGDPGSPAFSDLPPPTLSRAP